MQRTCVKCGHEHPNASGDGVEACPKCGAVYAKAQPGGARPVRRNAPQSGFDGPPTSRSLAEVGNLRAAFVDRLRSESLYPAFRGAASLVYQAMILIAVLVALGSVASAFISREVYFPAGGLIFALLIVVFARATMQASLMLADLCDASVRVASRQDQ